MLYLHFYVLFDKSEILLVLNPVGHSGYPRLILHTLGEFDILKSEKYLGRKF